MKFVLVINFCLLPITTAAQSRFYSNLKLVYPVQLTYDTLLIKDSEGKILSEISTVSKEGKTINTYSISVDSISEGSFSIYFGGSESAVNDSLFF